MAARGVHRDWPREHLLHHFEYPDKRCPLTPSFQDSKGAANDPGSRPVGDAVPTIALLPLQCPAAAGPLPSSVAYLNAARASATCPVEPGLEGSPRGAWDEPY